MLLITTKQQQQSQKGYITVDYNNLSNLTLPSRHLEEEKVLSRMNSPPTQTNRDVSSESLNSVGPYLRGHGCRN